MPWIEAAVAAVALVFAVFSWWFSTVSQRAKAEADAAEARAKETLNAVNRQADELRAIARSLEGPPWILTHSRKSAYTLTNKTGDVAENVRVEAGMRPTELARVGKNESSSVLISLAMGSSPNAVITWHHPTNGQQEFSVAIPSGD